VLQISIFKIIINDFFKIFKNNNYNQGATSHIHFKFQIHRPYTSKAMVEDMTKSQCVISRQYKYFLESLLNANLDTTHHITLY